MIELKVCPICGQYPCIKRDYGYENSGFGAWCTIQCKPLFRKPHLKVEEGKSSWDRALKYAVVRWNELAEQTDPTTEDCSMVRCERIHEDGVTCARYPACDDCSENPLNKVKGSERSVKGSDYPWK